MPASLSGGLTETASFDAQMAALSPAAAETVVVPAAAGMLPSPTTSATVFVRPTVACTLAAAPACVDEPAVLAEQCIPLTIPRESAPGAVDEADEGATTESGDIEEGGADAPGTPGSLIMELIASQQPGVAPVRTEPVIPRETLKTETSGVAESDVALADREGGAHDMRTTRASAQLSEQLVGQASAEGPVHSSAARTFLGAGRAESPLPVRSDGTTPTASLAPARLPMTKTVDATANQAFGSPVSSGVNSALPSGSPELGKSTSVLEKTSQPGEVTAVDASNVARVLQSSSTPAPLPMTKTVDATANQAFGSPVSSGVNSALPSGAPELGKSTSVLEKTSQPGEVTAVDASNVARVLQSSSTPAALPMTKTVNATADTAPEQTVSAEANSAGLVQPESAAVRNVPSSFSERKILNSGYKALADGANVAGIAGAKRYRAMISDITSTAGSMTPSAEHAVAGAVSAVAQGLQVADVAATEAMAPVSRAFEAVQDAVENLKASRQNVVEVTLSEGQDSPLHIRIEYRDGVVHTAFRTESPELREHLARDWQSSMSGLTTTDSGVRLADPVFSTPTSTSRDTGLDMGGQYARQQQSQQSPSQTTSSSGGLRHAGSETSSAASSMGSSAAPQSARPETARYLHTLA
ncbi:MAG: hypothetical protein BWX86_00877 [Verrucomicrobia bacterium ADurb.Bin122]|nr:MAG: hypothetical protein BWX86_00877 [Verrucomicrobia bacterium ADurb.Bin122]